MTNSVSVPVKTITTENVQQLYLSGEDARQLENKRVLIVDDVISTGEAVNALERLVEMAGGQIAGKACVLAEGDAAKRSDIVFWNRFRFSFKINRRQPWRNVNFVHGEGRELSRLFYI